MTKPPTDMSRALEQAEETLRLHIDDGAGYCLECQNAYSIVTPYPCTACEWANRTVIMAGACAK